MYSSAGYRRKTVLERDSLCVVTTPFCMSAYVYNMYTLNGEKINGTNFEYYIILYRPSSRRRLVSS